MGEEVEVALAEVVVPGFAIEGGPESVFGTAAVAGPADRAESALFGHPGALPLPKLTLLWAGQHVREPVRGDVAEPVPGLDVVVAGVDVAVVLDGQRAPALRRVHAQRVLPESGGEQGIKMLHEHAPDVVGPPLVENLAHEPAPLRRSHGP